MIARLIMFMLIAALSLPAAALSRPVDSNPTPWGEAAVTAKGAKHKKKGKKRKPTVPHTVRETVTQTFTSTQPITIADDSPAAPYPATIQVSGLSQGVITDVNLILDDFSHTYPRDVDILLSSRDGRQALVLSDLIDGDDAVNVDLTLDDEAAALLPTSGALASGTFRPTNIDSFPDTFAAPAPELDGTVALRTFDGADPSGTWQLWVMDNSDSDAGDLSGWALEITAEVDVQGPESGKAKNKKHKKQGKKRN